MCCRGFGGTAVTQSLWDNILSCLYDILSYLHHTLMSIWHTLISSWHTLMSLCYTLMSSSHTIMCLWHTLISTSHTVISSSHTLMSLWHTHILMTYSCVFLCYCIWLVWVWTPTFFFPVRGWAPACVKLCRGPQKPSLFFLRVTMKLLSAAPCIYKHNMFSVSLKAPDSLFSSAVHNQDAPVQVSHWRFEQWDCRSIKFTSGFSTKHNCLHVSCILSVGEGIVCVCCFCHVSPSIRRLVASGLRQGGFRAIEAVFTQTAPTFYTNA